MPAPCTGSRRRPRWWVLAAVALLGRSGLDVAEPRAIGAQSAFSTASLGRGAPAGVTGCYEFIFGSWVFATAWQGSPTTLLPRRIALDSIPVRFGSRFRGVRPAGNVADTLGLQSSTWESIGDDSLGISWNTRAGSMELRLQVRGDTLRGRAHAYTAERNAFAEPRASAAGIRVPCNASLPPEGNPSATALPAVEPTDSVLAQKEAEADATRFRRGETMLTMQRLHAAISQFRRTQARLPRQLEELLSLRSGRGPTPDSTWLVDAWGKAFLYTPGLDGYSIRSSGADGGMWSSDDVVSKKGPR